MKKITFLIVLLLNMAGISSAQSNVLVIDYPNSFSSDLNNNGSQIYNHLLSTQTSVTRVFSIPGSINPAQYDQVWIFGDMGYPNPANLGPIINYMNNGGAVYVQSEISCCTNQAAFVDQLIDSTVSAGGSISHNMTKLGNYQYSSAPMILCTPLIHFGAAVRPFIGTPTKNILFEANTTCGSAITTGDVVGVRFCAGDMITGKGALISNGDFNIFPQMGTCGSVGLLGTPNNTNVIDLISDLLPKLACDSPSGGGQLVLTANPQYFCGSTQLGWTYTPGTGGCPIIGCPNDTTYKWSVLSGEPINVPVNFTCDTCPYPIASPSIPTTYMLTITIGDTNACNKGVSSQIPTTVFPLTVPYGAPITYTTDCNGNMDMSISGYIGSLQWQMSTGGGPFTNINGATTDTLSQTAATGDCFRVEITSPCGTTYSDTVCLGILTPPVSGNVSYSADCQGNVSLNVNGYTGDLQWQSSVGGGPWNDISGATLDSLLQSGVSTGDCFRVQISTVCDTTFSDTACVVIPIYPDTGTIHYDADCKGNIDLWVTGSDGNLQWQVSLAGGPWTDIAGATTDSVSQSGISTGDCFRVMIYTVCDTVYTDTVCPTMLVGPIADFTASPPGNSQSNVPVTFTDNSTGNIVSWTWIWGDNSPSNNTGIPNPTHTYHNTGIYYVTLIVVDANGCTDTVTIPYIVDTLPGNHLIVVPNVFTPNGDGDNDFLVFKNLEKYNNHLQVYNRWGTLIYEATNYKNGWDGEKYSEGTYYFLLDVYFEQQGDPERFKGNITLLR